MTPRGARLVLATAGLAFGAAALSWLAPSLPEGLAAACAPDLVLRELLAGLAAFVLLGAPSFLADEPGRPAECHDGLLAATAAAPAAVALAAAGGMDPGALLPAATLLFACDLAASSYLRIDPAGRRGTLFAAAAASLLAGIPIAGYGLAEFGGWEGAAAAFRASPLLAVRDVAGGWAAVGPAALVLVAAAAVLRFGSVLRRAPAAALLLAVVAAPENATVLVVGAPREGGYAALLEGLRGKGRAVEEVDSLPAEVPWRTDILVFARPPRSKVEGESWEGAVREFVARGGNAVLWPHAAGTYSDARRALGGRFPGPDPVVDGLLRPTVAVPHPADRAETGVSPGVFRLPFPVAPRSLPGSTLGFLLVLAAATAGSTLFARSRALGALPSALVLGGVSAVGTLLLFLPGVLGPSFRVDRLVLEERVAWDDRPLEPRPLRRVELVRVERLRGGGEAPAIRGTELRFAADAGPLLLDAPGRWGILASVTGEVAAGAESSAPLATLRVDGGEARTGDGPPRPLADALSEWRRSGDTRVSRAGSILAECLRPPPGIGPLVLAVPAEGPDAVVIHSR